MAAGPIVLQTSGHATWDDLAAMSARQSPPIADDTARSSTTLAGSWIASGLRHGASASRSAAGSPTACAVRSSGVTPACGTTLDPSPPTMGAGYGPVVFSAKKVLRFLH